MVRRSVKARLYLQYDICGLIMYDNVLFYRQYITLECLLINKKTLNIIKTTTVTTIRITTTEHRILYLSLCGLLE